MDNTLPDDPLWLFSLELYGQPGAATACLALQDDAGADVNLVLYLLWCASTGRLLDASSIAQADARVAAWRRQIVEPLRGVRRAMKADLLPGLATGSCREAVKAVELASERLAQAALFAQAPAASDAQMPSEAAKAYLALYEAHLGCDLPEASLLTLLRAFYEA